VDDIQLAKEEHIRSEESIKEELTDYIDKQLLRFFEEFNVTKKPIQVNFRNLVSWVPYSESYTHYIHQYPAKLIKHIPIFFLSSSILNKKKGGVVLDPFCGSGTVLLEALLSGHNAIGCDSNPLARLIATVKTTSIDPSRLEKYSFSITKRAKQFRKLTRKNVVNVDHWFPPRTQLQLSKIHRAICEVKNEEERNFLLVTFSNIVKKTSFADPNLSVPVKIKPEKYSNDSLRLKLEDKLKKIEQCNIYEVFDNELKKNIERIRSLHVESIQNHAIVVSNDARYITKKLDSDYLYPPNSVDYILTSPPYSGAQKYIRSSSLNLGWLDYCEESTLRDYERQNIGREHYSKDEYNESVSLGIDFVDKMIKDIWLVNPLRAHINGNYLLEMEFALKEMYRVLKPDCFCTIVIGNNEVCGLNFESHKYLSAIAQRIGFKLELTLIDDIHSRGLMTKRNKTASIINSEWILIFRK